MLNLLFNIFNYLQRYTSKVTSYLFQSKFAVLHRIIHSLFGANKLTALSANSVSLRLTVIAVSTILIGTFFGFFFFHKIGWVFQEGRPITILSLIILLSIGYICERTFQVRLGEKSLSLSDKCIVWWFLSWGFYVAAWDEFLRLHETLDRQLHHLVGAKPNHLTDHLDDLFVAMYGVIGLRILWVYRSEIDLYFRSINFFLAAAAAGTLSVLIDTFGSDKLFLSNFFVNQASLLQAIDILDIFEETFKIGAEICFVALAISVHKIAIKLSKDNIEDASELT